MSCVEVRSSHQLGDVTVFLEILFSLPLTSFTKKKGLLFVVLKNQVCLRRPQYTKHLLPTLLGDKYHRYKRRKIPSPRSLEIRDWKSVSTRLSPCFTTQKTPSTALGGKHITALPSAWAIKVAEHLCWHDTGYPYPMNAWNENKCRGK